METRHHVQPPPRKARTTILRTTPHVVVAPRARRGAPLRLARPPVVWPVAPMKGVSGALPTGDGWIFEPKWDGHRALVRRRGDRVEVVSSSGKDRADRWPWIASLCDHLTAGDVVVDGEVVAMDDDGRHRFEYLGDPARAHALILFDLLQLDGASLLDRPWTERRAALESVVAPGGAFSLTPVSSDGALLWDVIVQTGFEGVVSKRVDGVYLPGRRSPSWRKTKYRHVQEFVVGGWLPGDGRRSGTIGSLVLGVHEPDGRLRCIGAVGSGFGDRSLDEVRQLMVTAASDTCPFDPVPPRPISSVARWANPTMVVQVEFAEWTGGGQLRHPVFLGLRDDVDPDTVTAAP